MASNIRAAYLAVAGLSIGLVLMAAPNGDPILVWNATPSVKIGFYRISSRSPTRGDIAAVRLPTRAARLADGRGYVPRHALLLKPTAAVGGDRVCRWHTRILINSAFRSAASTHDRAGRLLPSWFGCRRLRAGDVFILGQSTDSFDSRYFGVVPAPRVVGQAIPLWTR